MIYGVIVAVLIFLLDQGTKFYIAEHLLAEQMGMAVFPGFNVVRMWNTGVSFSMFNNYGKLGVILLSAFAIVVVLMLLWWMYKEQSRFIQIALALIIGGAIGNILDRIRFGAVFDFLDFYITEYHWPAFNLADSFICIGTILILIFEFMKNKEKK